MTRGKTKRLAWQPNHNRYKKLNAIYLEAYNKIYKRNLEAYNKIYKRKKKNKKGEQV